MTPRLFALFTALATLLSAGAATAATLSWPGVAPCDTSLQACVNAAAVNDTVQITAAAGEITAPLTINKPLVLTSASTARARFVGTTIQIQSTFAGTGNLNALRNMQLIDTPLTVSMGSNEPADEHVVELDQLDISNALDLTAGISLTTPQTASAKTLRIRHLRFAGGRGVSYTSSPPSAHVEVLDSHFLATRLGEPITLVLAGASSATLRRNRVEVYSPGLGICMSVQGAPGATVTADIDRNVTSGCDTGISLLAQTGAASVTARVRNNTLLSRSYGIALNGAALSAMVDNNIFSGTRAAGIGVFSGATVTAAHNLYHQAPQGVAGELNPIVADPQLVSRLDPHLQPGSPAINAAFAPSIPPDGDFDGVNSALPTIGAYNYQFGGSGMHVATAENSSSNFTVIADTLSRPLNEVMVQSVIEGFPLPAWAPHHLGVYTTTAAPLRTVIFSQNQQAIATPRAFFVMDSNRHQTFSHVAEASNISGNLTTVNWAPLNGNLFAKPVVVQRALPAGGVINDRAIGVWYDLLAGRWTIFNQDQSPMPAGAMFDIILPAPNAPYAFTAPAATATSLDLIIDHPLTNNSPCAAVFLTPVFQGVYVPSAVHARYRPTTNGGGRWTVLRGDGNLFQNGMDMHVYVDPARTRACLNEGLFIDGLE